MQTPLAHIIARKGHAVAALPPSATVAEAVRLMNQRRIGAVLVTGPDRRLLGIFTERDVLNRVMVGELDPKTTVLREVMTSEIATAALETSVEDAMTLFMERRVRHLPILDRGAVVGLVSIGDINRLLLEEHAAEARHLRDYIQGEIGATA